MGNTSSAKGRRAHGDQMAAFDKLLPSFRATLAQANHGWAATTILARWRRRVVGYRTPEEFARVVKHWDTSEHKRAASLGLVAP